MPLEQEMVYVWFSKHFQQKVLVSWFWCPKSFIAMSFALVVENKTSPN